MVHVVTQIYKLVINCVGNFFFQKLTNCGENKLFMLFYRNLLQLRY